MIDHRAAEEHLLRAAMSLSPGEAEQLGFSAVVWDTEPGTKRTLALLKWMTSGLLEDDWPTVPKIARASVSTNWYAKPEPDSKNGDPK